MHSTFSFALTKGSLIVATPLLVLQTYLFYSTTPKPCRNYFVSSHSVFPTTFLPLPALLFFPVLQLPFPRLPHLPFFLGSVFFLPLQSSPVFSFHDSSPSVSPSFPFFHIPQSLLIIIGISSFFINRKYYDDYDGVWKLWIKKRLRNPPKVIHSYCRFIPILIHKAGVAERRYCSGI